MQLVLRIIQNIFDGYFRAREHAAGVVPTNYVHPEDQIVRQHVLEEGKEIVYVVDAGRVEVQVGTPHSRRVSRLLAPEVPAYVDEKIAYVLLIFGDFCDLIISTVACK